MPTSKVWKARAFRKLGSFCICCEETRKDFLTFDHINGGGRTHRNQFTLSKFYQWIATDPVADQIVQVLCMNCNWGKRHKTKCIHSQEMPKEQQQDIIAELEEQIKELEQKRNRLTRVVERLQPEIVQRLPEAPEGFQYVRQIARLDWNEFTQRSLAPQEKQADHAISL